MKKGILLNADLKGNWIGGLYYIKNVAFILAQNEGILKDYNVYVWANISNRDVFDCLPNSIKTIYFDKEKNLLKVVKQNNIKAMYPSNWWQKIGGVTPIAWVPDFQHNHLKQMFSKFECFRRNCVYKYYGMSSNPLVLSSEDSLHDFEKFYVASKKNVYVLHFVSFIEQEIRQLNDAIEQDVLRKFGLIQNEYICVANQFWKHKNHIVIFKALKQYIKMNPESNIVIAFTGKLSDYRNPQYIEEIKKYLESETLAKHIKMLGFLERKEQIVVMKNAMYLIQPSLFEGWGTVVEDAKVLDKTILLSDISVHREQKNEKCILFNPQDEMELARLIEIENSKEHSSDIDVGIKNMYECARKYSKTFAQLLDDNLNCRG